MYIVKKINKLYTKQIMEMIKNNFHNFVDIPSLNEVKIILNCGYTIGLFKKNKLIGFSLCFKPNKNVFYIGNNLLVNYLFMVNKQHLGKNLGGLLLNELLLIAKKHNLKSVISIVSLLNIASIKSHFKKDFRIIFLLKRISFHNCEHKYSFNHYSFHYNQHTDKAEYLMKKDL